MFKGERKITLRRDAPKKAADVRRDLRKAVDLPAHAVPLFDALRTERSRIAKQQGVPPYVIFHDTTLRAMAMARPQTLDQMMTLPGVGTAKLDRYGMEFLKVIAVAQAA